MTKQDLGEIKGIVQEAIDARITPVETKISGIKHEVGKLKQEVGGLKHEVGELTQEVSGIKHEVGELKQEVNHLNQKVDQNHREVMARFDQFRTMESEDISAVQGDVEGLKVRVTKLEASRA